MDLECPLRRLSPSLASDLPKQRQPHFESGQDLQCHLYYSNTLIGLVLLCQSDLLRFRPPWRRSRTNRLTGRIQRPRKGFKVDDIGKTRLERFGKEVDPRYRKVDRGF